jgi:hypothetical protein
VKFNKSKKNIEISIKESKNFFFSLEFSDKLVLANYCTQFELNRFEKMKLMFKTPVSPNQIQNG